MSVNKVILLGYVGNDPEIRYPEPGHSVAYLRLATNERVGSSQTEITEWHTLVLHGQLAVTAERYIRKGSRLYAEGRLRTREYTDRMKITRKATEIYVDKIELLGMPKTN